MFVTQLFLLLIFVPAAVVAGLTALQGCTCGTRMTVVRAPCAAAAGEEIRSQ